jgi:uncharacterized membrane protein
MKTNRIEAFSDGVMAILITIMVLELKAPHDPTPASLAKLWPTLFAYVLSFIIIAIYWVNHHHLIHLVSRVDSVILWANINLLFWLSLIPWVTVYLGDNHALPFPVALYACRLNCRRDFVFFCCAHALARHHHEPEFARLNKKMARKNLVSILIYIAAIPAAFIYVPLALIMIALPAAMYFLPEHGTGKFRTRDSITADREARAKAALKFLRTKQYNRGETHEFLLWRTHLLLNSFAKPRRQQPNPTRATRPQHDSAMSRREFVRTISAATGRTGVAGIAVRYKTSRNQRPGRRGRSWSGWIDLCLSSEEKWHHRHSL